MSHNIFSIRMSSSLHLNNFSSKTFDSQNISNDILFGFLSCLKSKIVLLSNIDVLCFDECHDLVGRHQYVGIMQYLMCTKVDCIPPVDSPPIILGLTAGIGKSRSIFIRSTRFFCRCRFPWIWCCTNPSKFRSSLCNIRLFDNNNCLEK